LTPSRPLRKAAIAAAAVLFVACSLGDLDFRNKACPCGAEYVCDSTRNVCVFASDLLPDASAEAAATAADAGPDDASRSCNGEACPCVIDGDCTDRDRSRCSANKTCVECVAPGDCGAGTYCNAANQCVLGCKQQSDCQISPAAPFCDVARHECVECLTIADCTNADRCSPSGACVQGCNLDAGQLCPNGKECCQGLCIDTTNDLLNCGSCGSACSTQNGTPSCASSACTWSCASGYGHCETTNSGCETNLRTDSMHCGACATDCSTLVANATGRSCNAGVCDYQTCTANYADCDAVRNNGCECTCGTKKGERCCPGDTCNAPLTCLTGPKKCN
jgi:hypothetical protein